ncbi:hypothetical protein F5X71_03170 [Nocardia brasiliensis]|uniref:Mce-associated membrane protein n=1 Tax=Nocardia brasiliensis TaxID=37326 RepID=A0A6G9XKN5_NOCBR|nr:hypothetical protein [Nocardia brasiliensis]QIS01449.1 hypothetical protein F5X71_03170 [Nocardia brasiliensis]
MSDGNGDRQRARRRAVRSVGPPAAESVTSGVTAVPVEAGTTADPAPVALDKATAAEPVALGKAASVEAAAVITEPKVSAVEFGVPPVDAAEPRSGIGVGRVLAWAAAALLVLALVVGAGLSVVKVRSIDARDERRTEFVQTARQAALNLTTIRADSAKQDIDRILAVASGQFKSEFDGRVDPFLNVVQQAKIVSNGEVVEAALESDDVDSAQVLVAVKQTLTNAGQEGPQTRLYRFRITVSRGDAGLTASKVEFVG